MKFEYFDGEYGMNIDLKPETPKDMAELLRLVKNAKATKPEMRLYFESDSPSMSIFIRKISSKSQKKSITNQ